jgi:hypothetical protein
MAPLHLPSRPQRPSPPTSGRKPPSYNPDRRERLGPTLHDSDLVWTITDQVVIAIILEEIDEPDCYLALIATTATPPRQCVLSLLAAAPAPQPFLPHNLLVVAGLPPGGLAARIVVCFVADLAGGGATVAVGQLPRLIAPPVGSYRP